MERGRLGKFPDAVGMIHTTGLGKFNLDRDTQDLTHPSLTHVGREFSVIQIISSTRPGQMSRTVMNLRPRHSEVSASPCPRTKWRRDAAALDSLADGIAAEVVEDASPVALKLTVDDYFKSILPPLKPVLEERFDATWDTLCLSNAYDRVSLGWTALQSLPELNENSTYQALVEIAEQVVNASAFQALQQTFEFTQDPDRFPNSFLRHSEHKPDGYFVSCNGDSTKKANWMDIGPTGEYKKADTPKARLDVSLVIDVAALTLTAFQNNEKMLWSMQHTMREDPRRRHAHAFTIEKTTMRLWYSDRVDTVVSEAFDFMMVRVSCVTRPCPANNRK